MPNLTERSVFRIGHGSFAITIPKPWAIYYRLKPGDKLEIISDGTLKVYPPRKGGTRTIDTSVPKSDRG